MATIRKSVGAYQLAECPDASIKEVRTKIVVDRPWTVIVISHNSPRHLANLLFDLEREADFGVKIEVRIYDNASNVDLSEPLSLMQKRGWLFFNSESHYGNRSVWQLMNRAYRGLKDLPEDAMIAFLPQDVRLCQHFFYLAQEEWEKINDPRKIALTVLVDALRERKSCWTGIPPKRQGHVFRTQWVDCAFVAERSYLETLSYSVPPVPVSRWNRNPNLSSGVGRMISVKLHQAGFGLYRVNNSLVKHADNPSPKHLKTIRFVNDLPQPYYAENKKTEHGKDTTPNLSQSRNIPSDISVFSRSPVVASLATIPGREKNLARTVASLIPQVDRLNVYLNGIETAPDFLKSPRIQVAKSSDYGDHGDAGKFWWCRNEDVYYLTCDDDIVYPPDYVARMVFAIERYKRSAVVGVHGILLHQTIRSYYKSRVVFHCTHSLERDQPVHMVGSGCAGWHSSTLDVTHHHFKKPNMADVWFGVVCQQQQIPVLCVARPSKWLKIQKVTNTIFNKHRNRDRIQTQAVIAEAPWKIFRPSSSLSCYPGSLKILNKEDKFSKIRVSIIVPVGSDRGFLADALKSAAEQDYPSDSFEVIVVNDGCSDITEMSIRALWRSQAILRYTEIPKSGLSASVNRGLELAIGKFFTILPDDDIIYPQKLKLLCSILESSPEISVVYSLPQYLDEQSKKIPTPMSISKYLQTHELLTWRDITCGSRLQVHGTSTVYRTAAALSVGGWDENLDTAEEWEFHLRLLKYGFFFKGFPTVSTGYRIHPKNKSKKYRKNRQTQMEYIRHKLGLQGVNL